MSKKSSKKLHSKTKRIRKSFKGLKGYVIFGLIAIVAIGVAVFWAAWNKAALNVYDPTYSVISLPETGDITYYTNCIIHNINGIGNYPDKATIKCDYLGPQPDGYDYQTTQMNLLCVPNDLILMNVCTDGKVR